MSDQVIRLPKQPMAAESARAGFSRTPTGLKSLSDEDLIERLADGDHNALSLLFDRYHRLVLNVAAKIVRDPGEAEDLLQEVFFEVYRAAGSFNPEKGSAKAWILQYAYHRSLDRWRRLNLKRFYDTRKITEIESYQLGHSRNGSYGMTIEECSRLIEQGMSTLSKKQRKTLELAYFRGLSLAEIADHMGESLPNVRHHYYRGLDKLRDVLQTDSHGRRAVAKSSGEGTHAKA